MARVRAGNLDRRVQLQRAVETQNTFGELIKGWSPYATVWAELLPMPGGEAFVAEQRRSRQPVQFRVRYRAGISPQHRAVHRGETYEITDVSEPDRNHEVVLTCYAFETTSGA